MTSHDTTTQPRTFPVSGPLELAVRLGSGVVEVTAADTAEATVELTPMRLGDTDALDVIAQSRVELRGDSLRIDVPAKHRMMRRTPPVRVRVTVPTDSAVDAEVGSADVQIEGGIGTLVAEAGSGDLIAGSCGDARIRCGSGDVRISESQAITFKSGSGDLTIGWCGGDFTVQSGSGDVSVEQASGKGHITTASGDVELGDVGPSTLVKTASGDVTVRRASEGELVVKTASGGVTVGVAAGTVTRLECASVTGQVHSQLEPGDAPGDAERRLLVNARTVTGGITINRVS
ncbi:MAG: DUF4097 family beta strand repeat-containing protein [Micromonosporaceae bacterium]